MNIFVYFPQNEEFILRPDSTLNKDCSDYWIPGGIDALKYVPFFYLRIDKNAKSVFARFARRYWTFAGYGVYLYAPSMSRHMGHSLDFSTLVSAPVRPEQMNREKELFSNQYLPELEKAVEKITSICSLKSGDLVCIPCAGEKGVHQGDAVEFMDIKFSIK